MKVLLHEQIARYEDSQQIHSTDFGRFPPKVTMKKLSHSLILHIEGPDDGEGKARECFNKAIAAGLLAAVTAAFIGAGVGAAEVGFAAAKVSFAECLGDSFFVKLDSESQWIYWDL